MVHKITRSAGLPTGYMGLMAGSGYSGATKKLDEIVHREAELLSDAFDRDVEIRFNFDRQSGGAWLKDDLPGFAGNTQVGLGAAILAKPPNGKTRHQWHKELGEKYSWGREMFAEIDKAPKEVVIDTYISADVARNSRVVNSGNEGSRYASHEHPSLRAALTFLKRNVDRAKLNPYRDSVLEVSEGETVRGRRPKKPKPKRKSRDVSSLRGLR